MFGNLCHRTVNERTKRKRGIVLLKAMQFCFQTNAWRSTMQSVWQDLSRTETRRLHLTSHPHAAIWNKQCALRVIAFSLPLPLSLTLLLTHTHVHRHTRSEAHTTTLLLYYEKGGFNAVLCVCPYRHCSDNRGASRPVIGCLLQTVRLCTDWLLLCERAVHSRWQPQGTVRSQCESAFWRRGENTTGGCLDFIFICWLQIYVMAEHNTADNYSDLHCSIIVSVNTSNTILP